MWSRRSVLKFLGVGVATVAANPRDWWVERYHFDQDVVWNPDQWPPIDTEGGAVARLDLVMKPGRDLRSTFRVMTMESIPVEMAKLDMVVNTRSGARAHVRGKRDGEDWTTHLPAEAAHLLEGRAMYDLLSAAPDGNITRVCTGVISVVSV